LPTAGSASLIDTHDLTHLLPSEDFREHEYCSVIEAQIIGVLVSSIIRVSPVHEASVTQAVSF